MKMPTLLSLGMALMFGTEAAAYAQGTTFVWPPVHGPAIQFGPFTPGPRRVYRAPQPTRPLVQYPPPGVQSRPPARAETTLVHGEPDETGRIGPTFHATRDADGKLLPTYSAR